MFESQVEVLVETVKNFDGPSPNGMSCKFIKLNDEWGIKTYSSLYKRDTAYQDQAMMAALGYAPEVGVSFDVGTTYCYITQMAQPLVEGDSEGDDQHWKEFYEVSDDAEVRGWISDLCYKMREAGYYMCDRHVCNFGILGDKLVCIDFS